MSVRARLAMLYLRARRKGAYANERTVAKELAQPKTSHVPPARLRRRLDVDRHTIDGRPCWIVAPRSGEAKGALLYLHGGAYVHEIVKEHWSLVARIVEGTRCVAWVPIYGLAPDEGFRDAYAFGTSVYREVTTEHDPSRVVVMGDSAGGGLALGLVQSFVSSGLPRPARLVLLAPWVDLTLDNPEIEDVAPNDPWLSRAGLVACGRSWAQGEDPRLPELSPIRGAMEGLPPMTIYVGTRDILWPDARLLAERARGVGVEVELVEEAGMMHVYPLLPIPEGREATAQLVRRLAVLLS